MTDDPSAETSSIRRSFGKVELRSVFGPFVQLYARSFFAGVALQVLAIMTLVEAVFLAERFPMVFRNVFQNHADPYDTALLFLFNSTQVFDLALATAVLMAVYWTTLRMRENRELLVLFAAGTGPYRLLVLALTIAAVALVGSLTVSGVLDPASRYQQREVLFNAMFRALQNGINTGQFYQFPNRVAFAPARSTAYHGGVRADQTRSLFVYEQDKPGTFRVITADLARLDGPDSAGRILLKLGGFASRTFSNVPSLAGAEPAPAHDSPENCANCREQPKEVSRITMYAHDVTQEMSLDQLMTFMPRGSSNEELTIFDQLGAKVDSASPIYREEMRQLGERLARSFLCLLAPLIALAAVCLTSRATNYFVLPLACMGLMSLNVTSQWLIRVITPLSPLSAFGVPALLTAAFAALLLAEIIREQGKLARPQLARP
jgi:lipopolysaccharide export system permease protein